MCNFDWIIIYWFVIIISVDARKGSKRIKMKIGGACVYSMRLEFNRVRHIV